MDVFLSGSHAAMPSQALNDFNVRAHSQEVRAETVSEAVEMNKCIIPKYEACCFLELFTDKIPEQMRKYVVTFTHDILFSLGENLYSLSV